MLELGSLVSVNSFKTKKADILIYYLLATPVISCAKYAHYSNDLAGSPVLRKSLWTEFGLGFGAQLRLEYEC